MEKNYTSCWKIYRGKSIFVLGKNQPNTRHIPLLKLNLNFFKQCFLFTQDNH